MAGRESPRKHVPQNSWLVSFNDLLTLLLTFFILVVALSSVHSAYLKKAADSFSQTFDAVGTEGALKETTKGSLESLQGLKLREGKNTIRLSLNDSTLFEKGSADILPGAYGNLKELASLLKDEEIMIRVEGHTDNIPIHTDKFPSNWELSVARAASIVKFLAHEGVPVQKLSVAGYADARPVAPNSTEMGRAMNRRTEIILWWQEEPWQGKKN